MTVLHQADVDYPLRFIDKLRGPPYYLVLQAKQTAMQYARRLSVAVVDEAAQLPLAHPHLFMEMKL